jgi:murein peptide amidase A
MISVRFNKNKGKYLGESIDVRTLLGDFEKVAATHNWTKEVYFRNGEFEFPAYIRKGKSDALHIYISAGIHGDEPAGPLASLRLMKELPTELNVWMCPVLNPFGLNLNQRENEKGVDLNRDYKTHMTPEVKAHVLWIERQPIFDLTLCLHEDWEASGFYLYTSKAEKHAERIIEAVKKVFPIDLHSTIDGFPAENGIIRPEINREKMKEWPEAFYLRERRGGEHYTFETSSDYELTDRVNALMTATLTACSAISLSK